METSSQVTFPATLRGLFHYPHVRDEETEDHRLLGDSEPEFESKFAWLSVSSFWGWEAGNLGPISCKSAPKLPSGDETWDPC